MEVQRLNDFSGNGVCASGLCKSVFYSVNCAIQSYIELVLLYKWKHGRPRSNIAFCVMCIQYVVCSIFGVRSSSIC